MPFRDKFNLEVGCRSWRFDPSDHPLNGGSKRGGHFVENPLRHHQQRPASVRHIQTQSSRAQSVAGSQVDHASISSEVERIEMEKRLVAAERARLEELNRETAEKVHRLEELSQKATLDREKAAEMVQRAAEVEERQKVEQHQAMEVERARLLAEADERLQQLRDQVAAMEQKHQAEILRWEERERRAAHLELEAEARAKAREAAEEARAAERERELSRERAAALDRLRQEAIEDYKRAGQEVRRTQEEQLKKEIEETRQKILEENAIRKAALEEEKEATLANLKVEAQREYQKHLDEQKKLDQERAEALKAATAKTAQELQSQQLEALRKLYSASKDYSTGGDPSLYPHASKAALSMGPIPPDASPTLRELILRQRRQALREGSVYGVGGHALGPNGRLDGYPYSAPHRVLGVSPGSTWGSPLHRPHANSVGQTNVATPFGLRSTMPMQLSHNHLLPNQAALPPSGTQAYPQSSHISAYRNQGNTFTAAPSRSSSSHRTGQESRAHKHMQQARNLLNSRPGTMHKASESLKAQQMQPLIEDVQIDDPSFCVVTLSSVPGFRIAKIFGEAFGVALRDIPDLPRAKEMTMEEQELMLESAMLDRRRAVINMITQAKKVGANCVIGLAFETHAISPGSAEIWAVGTAVILKAESDQSALPNSTEQATRTALENQLHVALPGLRAKGKGVEGDPQAKKNKNKGKKAENSDVSCDSNADSTSGQVCGAWGEGSTSSTWGQNEKSKSGQKAEGAGERKNVQSGKKGKGAQNQVNHQWDEASSYQGDFQSGGDDKSTGGGDGWGSNQFGEPSGSNGPQWQEKQAKRKQKKDGAKLHDTNISNQGWSLNTAANGHVGIGDQSRKSKNSGPRGVSPRAVQGSSYKAGCNCNNQGFSAPHKGNGSYLHGSNSVNGDNSWYTGGSQHPKVAETCRFCGSQGRKVLNREQPLNRDRGQASVFNGSNSRCGGEQRKGQATGSKASYHRQQQSDASANCRSSGTGMHHMWGQANSDVSDSGEGDETNEEEQEDGEDYNEAAGEDQFNGWNKDNGWNQDNAPIERSSSADNWGASAEPQQQQDTNWNTDPSSSINQGTEMDTRAQDTSSGANSGWNEWPQNYGADSNDDQRMMTNSINQNQTNLNQLKKNGNGKHVESGEGGKVMMKKKQGKDGKKQGGQQQHQLQQGGGSNNNNRSIGKVLGPPSKPWMVSPPSQATGDKQTSSSKQNKKNKNQNQGQAKGQCKTMTTVTKAVDELRLEDQNDDDDEGGILGGLGALFG